MTLLKRQIISVKAVIIDKKGKVLLIRHSYKRPNKWYLPGGLIWYGERPDDGIKREIAEELGLKIKDAMLVGIYKGQNKSLAVLFTCRANYGSNTPLHGHAEIKEVSLFPLSELPRNTAPGVKQSVKDAMFFLKKGRKHVVWGFW